MFMYYRLIITNVILLIFTSVVFAGELEIPVSKRVKNLPSGCCGWCSIENLGHVHGIVALDGLAKRRHERHEELIEVKTSEWSFPFGWTQVSKFVKREDAPATPARVREELANLKVKFKVQDESSKDMTMLKSAIDASIGCAVGVYDWPDEGDYHMVTLTDLTDKKCVFIENRGKCERYEGTREWFNAHWSGFTVVVYPENK